MSHEEPAGARPEARSPLEVVEDFRPVVVNKPGTPQLWSRLAQELTVSGRVAPAVLAAARAVGAGGPVEPLRALLAAHATELDADECATRTRKTVLSVGLRLRLRKHPVLVVESLVQDLLAGADAAACLREVASVLDVDGDHHAALETIRGALAVASTREYEYTHATVLMSLARWEEAGLAADRLAGFSAAEARTLRCYLASLTQPLAFWPATDPATVVGEPDPDQASARTVGELSDAITTAARRVAALRDLIDPREAPWLGSAVALTQDAAGVDLTGIDMDNLVAVPDRLLALRREWQRLTWLCHAAGLDEVGIPAVEPDRPLGATFDALLARWKVVAGLADGDPLDDTRRSALAGYRWGDAPADDFASMAGLVAAEHRAAVFAVGWALGLAAITSPFPTE